MTTSHTDGDSQTHEEAWPDSPLGNDQYYDHVVPAHQDEDATPVEDLPNKALRAEIAYHVSVREPDPSGLSKKTINSAFAYLTGEFAVHPNYLYTAGSDPSVPSVAACRRLLLGAAAGPELVAEAMNRRGTDPYVDRRYVKDELEAIVEAIRETVDQREWAKSF